MTTKSAKLNTWDLALIEEALRAYESFSFNDHAKGCRVALIEKIASAKTARVYFE